MTSNLLKNGRFKYLFLTFKIQYLKEKKTRRNNELVLGYLFKKKQVKFIFKNLLFLLKFNQMHLFKTVKIIVQI